MTTLMRALTPEQQAEWSAQEQALPKHVQTQILVESSLRLEASDPGGTLRAAVGTAIDTAWLGDQLEVVTFGDGPIVTRRVGFSSLVGGAISGALASSEPDESVSLGHTLSDTNPHYEGHAELVLVLAAPQISIPLKTSYMMLNSPFVIGSIGGEPGQGLQRLAGISGGYALPVRNAREATALGERFVQSYRRARKSKNRDEHRYMASLDTGSWDDDDL